MLFAALWGTITTMHWSIRTGFLLLGSVTLLGFITFTLIAAHVVGQIKVNGPLYTQIVLGKDLIADILPPPRYIIESYLLCLQMLGEQDQSAFDTLAARGTALKSGGGGYDERHQYWERHLTPGPMRTAHAGGSPYAGPGFLPSAR